MMLPAYPAAGGTRNRPRGPAGGGRTGPAAHRAARRLHAARHYEAGKAWAARRRRSLWTTALCTMQCSFQGHGWPLLLSPRLPPPSSCPEAADRGL